MPDMTDMSGMKYFLSLLLLFSSYTFASEDLKKYVRVLDLLNTKSFSGGTGEVCVDQDQELMQKCAQELCGKPFENPSPALVDGNFDQYVQSDDMEKFNEIEGDLKSLLNESIDEKQKFISAFKKKLNDKEIKLDFNSFSNWDFDEQAHHLFIEHLDIAIDKRKPLAERITVSIQLPNNKSETYKKALDSFARFKEKQILEHFPTGVSQGLYEVKEAKEIFTRKWQNFYKKYKTLKQEDQSFLSDYDAKVLEINNKVQKGQLDNMHELVNDAYMYDFFKKTIEFTKTQKWPEVTLVCGEVACRQGVQEGLESANFQEMIGELEEKNSKDVIAREMANCKSEFASMSIKDYDTESFRALIPEVKQNLIKNVFGKYSTESSKAFEKYLDDELNFSLKPQPSDVENFITKVKEAAIEKNNFSELGALDLVRKLQRYISFGEINPFAELSLCKNSLSYAVWDAYSAQEYDLGSYAHAPDVDTDKDNIFISQFSCTHQSHGKGILAHELGHALSWRFSKNKLSSESYGEYKKLRTCAANLYKNASRLNGPASIRHENDTFTTEEDMADLISFMTYPTKSPLFACAFLGASMDGKSYADAELKNRYEFSFHSSPLLRALQEAIHKRVQLPQSCKEVVEKNKNKNNFRFEPCF